MDNLNANLRSATSGLPHVEEARSRIRLFLTEFGEGRIDHFDDGMPPLYTRDIEALFSAGIPTSIVRGELVKAVAKKLPPRWWEKEPAVIASHFLERTLDFLAENNVTVVRNAN